MSAGKKNEFEEIIEKLVGSLREKKPEERGGVFLEKCPPPCGGTIEYGRGGLKLPICSKCKKVYTRPCF